MKDEDGYPTEETLDRIAKWGIRSYEECRKLAEFVQSLWQYPDCFTIEGDYVRAVTGGWSGNESLVSAMKENWAFTALCWQRSTRGGLHEYALSSGFDLRAIEKKSLAG